MQMAVINWETKTVTNIIEYTEDVAYHLEVPLGYAFRDCTGIPLVIGDTYDDETGCFLRDGEEVEREATAEERLDQIEALLEALAGGVI